jgi:hypothetical protein
MRLRLLSERRLVQAMAKPLLELNSLVLPNRLGLTEIGGETK